MSRARADVLVVLLWLGVAAVVLVLLESKPPETAELPRPVPKALSEEVAQESPARVLLPPPPRLRAKAPPPKVSAPAPKPEPTPAPKQVKALKPAPKPAPATTKPTPPKPVTPKSIATITPLPATPDPPKPPEPATTPEPAPEPPPEAMPEPIPETITVAEPEAREGRTLLRLLEHGAGPEIELAWPAAPADRARLFRHLRACLGMELAVMDSAGRLIRDGALWRPNLDRYSGFLRRPSGRLAPEEQGLARAGGQAVRLFPRQVDALLLGGLHALIGADYGQLTVIHGRYRLDGAKVLIERVAGDGRAYPGQIDLSPAATRGCRHGYS